MKSNDPPPDSLFKKLNEFSCCCLGCKAVVPNSTEARDGHLNAGCPAWGAHCRGEHVEGWDG